MKCGNKNGMKPGQNIEEPRKNTDIIEVITNGVATNQETQDTGYLAGVYDNLINSWVKLLLFYSNHLNGLSEEEFEIIDLAARKLVHFLVFKMNTMDFIFV